jgi:hypothetical protein
MKWRWQVGDKLLTPWRLIALCAIEGRFAASAKGLKQAAGQLRVGCHIGKSKGNP